MSLTRYMNLIRGIRRVLASSVLGLMVGGPSWSAPNQASSYLINEPVSLLDWGMYKTEQFLESVEVDWWSEDFDPHVFNQVWYDWDRDRIVIDVQLTIKAGNPTRAQCASVLRKMVESSLVPFDTRKPRPTINDGVSTWGVAFAHSGYVAGNEPKDLGKKVDDIIEFRAIVSNNWGRNAPLRQVECTTKLKEPKVFYSER